MNMSLIKRTLLLLVIVKLSIASNLTVIHNELEPISAGDKAYFELNITDGNTDIYEARLFYRNKGDADFKSKTMSEQGYTLFSDLDTKNLSAGNVANHKGYKL